MLKPEVKLFLWQEKPQMVEPHEAGMLSWGSVVSEERFPEGKVSLERYECTLEAFRPVENTSLCMIFQNEDWTRDDFLLVPAAVYNGNRFRIRKTAYAPMFLKEEYALDPPITTTDIPHFMEDGSAGRISLRAGDSSVPAVFLYQPKSAKAIGILYECRSSEGTLGENGIILEEGPHGLTVTIMNPVIRWGGMYRFGNIASDVPCEDRPGQLQKGQKASLIVEQYEAEVHSLAEFYRFVLRISHQKNPLAGQRTVCSPGQDGTPSLAGAFRLIEKKYNTFNWRENPGFYQVGEGQNRFSIWQTGWVGGINAAYALYRCGNPVTGARALKTMDYLFRVMQAESGLFYGISDGTTITGDDFANPENRAFSMVRKNADALYFSALILLLMKGRRKIPDPLWVKGLRKAADAFVRLYTEYGQLGQFIHADTGEILVGGSCAGGLVPAALLKCAEYFGDPVYQKTAEEIALLFDREYVQKGIVNGGPGEILSAPDSESAYAVLESFVSLYETTGSEAWLQAACRAADIYATWCMAYDYPFPEESLFGRLKMHSTGAVWANVQNKHGAPGPCTFSGSALLRLAKLTGEPLYEQIGEETVRNITQYISRASCPLWNYDHSKASPPGFICERVSTSDWEGFDKIGGIYETGCWCEATVLLMRADPECMKLV